MQLIKKNEKDVSYLQKIEGENEKSKPSDISVKFVFLAKTSKTSFAPQLPRLRAKLGIFFLNFSFQRRKFQAKIYLK